MGQTTAKRELRCRLRRERAALGAEERRVADAGIARTVLDSDIYGSSGTLFTYLSFGSEVDTRAIIERAWDDRKEVALPRVVGGRRMRWYRIDGFVGLERSHLGVEEPVPDPGREIDPTASSRALAIVPGLAFDRQGYRLGYGGGFYDVFLAGFPGVALGLCRERFLLESLLDDTGSIPILDPYDMPVHAIATERRILPVHKI